MIFLNEEVNRIAQQNNWDKRKTKIRIVRWLDRARRFIPLLDSGFTRVPTVDTKLNEMLQWIDMWCDSNQHQELIHFLAEWADDDAEGI